MEIVIGIIVIVVALFINYWFAAQARDAAEAKGHDGRKWFHLCFWLGIVPYMLVAALPDLELRRQVLALKNGMPDAEPAAPAAAPAVHSRVFSDEVRTYRSAPVQIKPAAKKPCPHCGAQNTPTNTECWVCHKEM